jgi:predicted acylesterase/phospholipase RssA
VKAARLLVLAALVTSVAACAAHPINVKLDRHDTEAGYRYDNLEAGDNSDDLFVILAFSGGGTRAAAFSFGVMEGLRDAEYSAVLGRRQLLQDVDVIASVSGGSFTAAYYALFRETFFDAFPANFLHRNIERELVGRLALNWPRLMRSDFDRIHLAYELYDETVFQQRTFADLKTKPYVILNATDMALGRRFEFTQEQFDLLCSDVGRTRIAAGVAASSAFPGLLSPLTLQSFAAEGCQYTAPEWLERALVRERNPLERYARARDFASYQDPKQERRYIHLLDGGLSDNIGLRGPSVALRSSTDVQWSVLARVNEGRTRRVVVIAANAKTRSVRDWDQQATAPGVLDVLGLVTSGPMDNYSFDTVQLVRDFAREQNQDYAAWASCNDTVQKTCGKPHPDTRLPAVDYHAIEVSFDALGDERARRCLESLPTSFALEEAQVRLLREAGRSLLLSSREFRRAMAAIDPASKPIDAVIQPSTIDAACPPAAAGASP